MFSGQELIVSLGSSIGVEDAIRLERAMPGKPLNVVLESVEQLPTQWEGYEGVTAARLLSTSRPELYRRLTSSSRRCLAALDEWVQRGGS